MNLDYLIDLEWDEYYLESYMLGFDNIAKLTICNNGIDITKSKEVIMNFNEKALLKIGLELIRRAHKYKDESIYYDNLGISYINHNTNFQIKTKTFLNYQIY